MPSHRHKSKHSHKKRERRKVSRSSSTSRKSDSYSPDYSSSSNEHWHKANKRSLDHYKDKSKKQEQGSSNLKKYEKNWEHDRLEYKTRKQQLVDCQQDLVRPKKNFNVNNTALAGIISEQKKTNARLDREEVTRANQKFKKIDHSDRQATLMSKHINQTEIFQKREEYTYQVMNGQYVRIHKPYVCNFKGMGCGERFAFSQELEEHMKGHFNNEH